MSEFFELHVTFKNYEVENVRHKIYNFSVGEL